MIKLSLICPCDCPRCDFKIWTELQEEDHPKVNLNNLLVFNGCSPELVLNNLKWEAPNIIYRVLDFYMNPYYGDESTYFFNLIEILNLYHDCLVSVEKV